MVHPRILLVPTYLGTVHRQGAGSVFIKPVLTAKESTIITSLKSLLDKNIFNPLNLELFATIWYLLPHDTVSKYDKETVLKVMCTEKPYFTGQDVKFTMDKILKFRKSLSQT